MSVVANRLYNDPALGQAFSSLAEAFAPPSGSDLSGYAAANATKQKAQQLAWLFDHPTDPTASARSAVTGVQGYGQTPDGFTYATDQGNATQRYGYDKSAQASVIGNLYSPLSEGQVRPAVPEGVASMFGMPAIDAAQGSPKPMSETEWDASQKDRLLGSGQLTDEMILNTIVGAQTPVKAVGPDGKELYMSPGAAVQAGARPAATSPSTVVNMGPDGIDYGSPGDGLVWQRSPDGKVALDDRGAPIAIPYQGGKVWAERQAKDAAADNKQTAIDTKANIVVQDLDRTIKNIADNPAFTTGVGQQATGWLAGTPAKDVTSLLDTIRANVGFDSLQAMRDQSPTGAALGNVTEKETGLLQATLGSIDPNQSLQQLTDNLKRLKNVYLDIIHGPDAGPPREKLSFDTGAPATGSAPARARNPRTGEVLVLVNGQWVPE